MFDILNGAGFSVSAGRRSKLKPLWTLPCTLVTAFLLLAGASDNAPANGKSAPLQPEVESVLAPVISRGKAISNQYIVVFGGGISGPDVSGKSPTDIALARDAVKHAEEAAAIPGVVVGFQYRWALIGFSASLSPTALQAMRRAPGVSWIETDDEIAAPSVDSGVVNKKPSRTVNSTSSAMLPYNIQRDPPRGLDRIGQRLPLANNQYAYSGDGSGVHVYVIDSGIRSTHAEFGNRVRVEQDQWYNATSDSHGVNGCLGRGHGTHVAGIIGGKTYGAAKNVTLHPVRVFGCAPSTPNAMVVAGVDWATKHHVTSATKFAAVANLSLGYDIRDPLDLREALYVAVKNSIDTGITYVVAAGNSAPIAGGGNKDACYITPARVPGAITVGATVPGTDYKALISNVGQCIDLFAPGTRIESAWNTGDHDHVEAGGTSMAAPHVAGIAALLLQSNPNASPADVWAAINAVANNSNTLGWCGVINRGTGSPNILLHWGAGSKDGAKDIEKDLPGQDPCPNFSEGVRRAVQSPR